MKRQRIIVTLAVFLTIVLLAGCETVEKTKITIKPEQNSLISWKEELPKETNVGSVVGVAIRGLEIVSGGETVFAVSYEPREYKESYDYWSVSAPYESGVSVNTENLYQLFTTLQAMSFTKTSLSAEESGIYDSKSSLFIAYDESQGEEGKGQTEPTKGIEILIGGEDMDGNYYVAAAGEERKVFLCSKVLIDSMLDIVPYEYILKVPVLINRDTVSSVVITVDESQHVMKNSFGDYSVDGRSVKEDEYNSLYGKLLGVIIEGEMPKGKEKGRNERLRIEYDRTDENVTDVLVQYFDYDENYMSVMVNEKEYFLVDRAEIESLIEEIQTTL